MSNSDVIIDLGSDFMDFADTSAAILELDLIISVDTAVAHLAGAFGIPVWIILSNPAGYLWMRNRTDTPWYPSARLYRQDNLDDWARVLEEIFQDLSNCKKIIKRLRHFFFIDSNKSIMHPNICKLLSC